MQTATPTPVTAKHPALPAVDMAALKARPQGSLFSGDAMGSTTVQIVGETL